MTSLDLDAYFRRIGYDGPREPSLPVLRAIHARHPIAIPFENLDTFHGRVPVIELGAIAAKLVHARRGGYCYEQNTLLKGVLEALGFRVTALLAKVRWGVPAEREVARSHMILRVDMADGPWIADVGFGGNTLTAPLRLEPATQQPTPHEPFRLLQDGAGFEQQVMIGSDCLPTYRFTLEAQNSADIEKSNWYTATHPSSRFTGNLLVARVLDGGRLALLNTEIAQHRTGAETTTRTLTAPEALADVLTTEFGIRLPAWSRFERLFKDTV